MPLHTCLLGDTIPYYRKRWRIAFYTVCTTHHTMMLDRCPQCAASVAFHRLDIANGDAIEVGTLAFCHGCGFDLRLAPAVEPLSYDKDAAALLLEACKVLGSDPAGDYKWDLGRYSVLHQLCMILTSKYRHVSLRDFVLDQIGCQDIPIAKGRISFEMRSIDERDHLLQLAIWLMVLPDTRLELAWRGGAVRYNVLLKDFSEPPDWYQRLTQKFVNWRMRYNQ